MAAISLFWDTNLAFVTSCANVPIIDIGGIDCGRAIVPLIRQVAHYGESKMAVEAGVMIQTTDILLIQELPSTCVTLFIEYIATYICAVYIYTYYKLCT